MKTVIKISNVVMLITSFFRIFKRIQEELSWIYSIQEVKPTYLYEVRQSTYLNMYGEGLKIIHIGKVCMIVPKLKRSDNPTY